jgi:uncharacterized membrane protein YcjF (UPF0283 family)
MRLQVRSRIGNALLGLLGAVYTIAALSLLAYAVVQTWAAQSLVDYAAQVVLLVAAAVGIFFIITAKENLHLDPMQRLSAIRHSRTHREAAAARS